MAESIFDRVKRLVSGKIEDRVDAMERAGGTSVMREAIREVERAIDDAKTERDNVTVRRLQAVRQQKLFEERLDSLTEKARFALESGREDLAEAALSRQVDFEAQIKNLSDVEATAAEEERELEEGLASLELRVDRMREELKAFEQSRVETGIDKDTGENDRIRTQRKVEREEAAFNRAMTGAGGHPGLTPVDVDHFNKLGELEQMQRSAVIAERLAALKKKAS